MRLVVEQVLGKLRVRRAQGIGGACCHSAHILELQRHMVLAFAPALVLLKAGGAVAGQHLVARFLHKQVLFRAVHALEGVGGACVVTGVADERAHVVLRKVEQAVLPGLPQPLHEQAISLVDVFVARARCIVRCLQLVKKGLVSLNAIDAAEQRIHVCARLACRRELFKLLCLHLLQIDVAQRPCCMGRLLCGGKGGDELGGGRELGHCLRLGGGVEIGVDNAVLGAFLAVHGVVLVLLCVGVAAVATPTFECMWPCSP